MITIIFEIIFIKSELQSKTSTNSNIMPKSITPVDNLQTKNENSSFKKLLLLLLKTQNLFVKKANKTEKNQEIMVESAVPTFNIVNNANEIIFTKVVSAPKSKYKTISLFIFIIQHFRNIIPWSLFCFDICFSNILTNYTNRKQLHTA